MDERSPKRRRTSQNPDVSSSRLDPQSTTPKTQRTREQSSTASPTRAASSRLGQDTSRTFGLQTSEASRVASTTAGRTTNAAPRTSLTRNPAARRRTDDDRVPASEPEGDGSTQGNAREEALPANARSAAARSRATAAAPVRASPARPNPRPLPPPEPEDDIQPFIGRARRSPVTGITTRRQEEPDLPPARPDPVSSTPPKGIHSSPSKWRGGKRKEPKSSPLKQPALRPGDEQSDTTRQAVDRRTRLPLDDRDDNHQDNLSTEPARKVSLLDPVKAKERDSLREEVAQLQRDLQVASKENERLLVMQTSGRSVALGNDTRIFDLLRRSVVPTDLLAQPPQSQQLVMAALNPMGLLPFSKPESAPATAKELDKLKTIKSHHPVDMTAEEELPYLQLFSPFDVTSTIAALPPTTQYPFRQRRLLTLRSKHTPPLFHSRVEMVVNPMTLGILELNVSALEPAARHELGPFLDKICSGKCNRSMDRNIGILSWAMGDWQRVALQRAGTWARLEKELATKGALLDTAARLRTRKRRSGDAESAVIPKRRISVKGADLLRLMGRQSFEVTVDTSQDAEPAAQLRFEWKIGFDWTGEAESKLTVRIGVPGKWRQVDRRGSLNKLPRLFQDLVRGGEDIDLAARKIAALLAGEQVMVSRSGSSNE